MDFDERDIGIRADMHRFNRDHAHFRPPLDDPQPHHEGRWGLSSHLPQ
jgi:hypothetical protein